MRIIIAVFVALCALASTAHAQSFPGLAAPNQMCGGPATGSTAAPPACRALVGADLPAPTGSTPGGVEAVTCPAHQWIDVIAGIPVCAQPGFSDLSGSLSPSQCPAATASQSGCVEPDSSTIIINGSNKLALPGQITAGGPTGDVTHIPQITYNAQGQLTAVSSALINPFAQVASPTNNAIYKGQGSSPPVASALSDNGTVVSASEPVDLTNQTLIVEIANSATGTTVNKLAKLTGAPSTAVMIGTTDTGGMVGIVVGGAGTSGNAQIAIAGRTSCVFDGSTTAGDYFQASSGTAGDCTDAGSAYPGSGQALGRVLTTNTGIGTYAVLIFPPEDRGGSGGGSGTVTSVNVVAGTGISQSGTCNSTSSINCTISNTGVTSIAAAGGLTQTNSTGAVTLYAPGGSVNVLRNNTLTSWFHGTSITIPTTGGWCAEGVWIIPTGASVTCSMSTLQINAGPYHAIEIVGNTGVTDVQARFVVESLTANKIANQVSTFQIYFGNFTGASITPTLTTKYATNGQDGWSTNTTNLSATNLSACATNSNCLDAYTLSVSGNADQGYEFIVDFGNSLSSNAKDLFIDYFDARATPGVSTGINSNPPPAEILSPGDDVVWNQRFFQASYDNLTAPGTNTRNGLAGGTLTYRTSSGGVNLPFTVPLKTTMRCDPSISYWDGAGNANDYSTNANNTWSDTNNAGTTTFQAIGTNSFQVYNGTPNNFFFHYTADCTIAGG